MPLHDSDIKTLAKLDVTKPKSIGLSITGSRFGTETYPGLSVFAKAGNRMGTARRCNLARLFLTLEKHWRLGESVTAHREMAQIFIRVSESIITSLTHLNLPTKSTDLLTRPRFMEHFRTAIIFAEEMIEKSFEDRLMLPDDSIEELKRTGLL